MSIFSNVFCSIWLYQRIKPVFFTFSWWNFQDTGWEFSRNLLVLRRSVLKNAIHKFHCMNSIEPKKATDNPPEKFGSHWKSVNAIFLFCIPSLKTFSSLAILVWLTLFWNLNNNFTRGKFCYWWIGWIPSRKNIQKKLSNQSMETSPMLEGLWLKRSDKVYLEKNIRNIQKRTIWIPILLTKSRCCFCKVFQFSYNVQ